MRLWSLHPKHLDTKGLVALWREALLAKHVLEGKTKGYKNHPQLNRFKKTKDPVGAINQYLSLVHDEAEARQYHFDKNKIGRGFKVLQISVTSGQMDYELEHLKRKLSVRDKDKWKEINALKKITPHSLFKVVKGKVEDWEIIN